MNKTQELKKLEEKILRDSSLPLRESATNLVFGKGNPDAKILIIGEAPGKQEDLQGVPFVGAAGKNLDKFLRTIGLTLDDVYIANVVKYRPPENRNPTVREIEMHAPYLFEQIRIINPRVICPLGNFATKYILSGCDTQKMKSVGGISSLHGKPVNVMIHGEVRRVIPLYHPAALIYNRSLIPEMEADLRIVKEEISKIHK